MNDTLLTTADLAERLRLTEPEVLELRRRHDWPCVVFSRKRIRFTPDQADEIIRRHAVTPTKTEDTDAPALAEGQTAASRRRRAS